MQATQEIMVQTSKKKSSKPKSDAQKLIPPKRGKGRRTAAAERSVIWIVAAAESFPVRPEEQEEIPPVICLPCLDIKFEEKAKELPVLLKPDFTRPPVSASLVRKTIMGVPVTPLKLSSSVRDQKQILASHSLQNGVVNHTPILKSSESKSLIQVESDLDADLTMWMKEAFSKYITLAGQKPNEGRQWGFRMAQVACGFDVMAEGTKKTKEIFPYFVTALFEMLDGAKSIRDLGLLEYILKDSVYLDVLAEAAEFSTKNGSVSVNLQNYYDDKYSGFFAASELLREG